MDLTDFKKLSEEPLKSSVAKAFFENFDFSGDKIDFIITYNHKNKGKPLWVEPILWAEGKKGKSEIFKSLTQLILTIGKHKFYTHFPPPYLGAFDAFSFAFVPYYKLDFIFTRSDIDFSVTPSNQTSESFKHLLNEITPLLEKEVLIFDYEMQKQELKAFIKDNLLYSKRSKIPVDKNNFVHVYFKWVEHVKPSISIEWQQAKKQGILDADFYLADLLSESNETILESLNTILKVNHYKFNKKLNNFGAFNFDETSFNDKQQAHSNFWSIYERPPKREFWDYIIQRRDLLVSDDVRERKGAFFTPKIWVEKSQEYLAKILGQDYQDEYIIWDCAGGTGNLLSGLINKANLYLSTLDKSDVSIVKERIKNGAKLLENHVFQFDFLNDDFFSEKVPKSLQEILKDQEKLKKLIIYINPPYAEASTTATRHGTGNNKPEVATTTFYTKNKSELGSAGRELFAQFFMRIYKELNGVTLASFSTLKNLQGSNFKKFREVFKAEFKGGFMVPADSFDNVKGQFPIGFLVWNTKADLSFRNPKPKLRELKGNYRFSETTTLSPKKANSKYNSLQEFLPCNLDMINSYKNNTSAPKLTNSKGQNEILQQNPLKLQNRISLEVFDSFGGFLGTKNIVIDDENNKPIIHFLRPFYDKKTEPIAFLRMIGADFQNSIGCFLTLTLTPNDVNTALSTPITTQNIYPIFLYLTIRHCIKATWQNDRDQFYAPYNDAWQDDNEFKNNALAFMLFHTQNRISLNASKTYAKRVGINHFIPFSEQEVNAKERYTSHVLLDFLKGKTPKKESDNLFDDPKKEIKPLEFSENALSVFNAGKEIYRYYHAQDFTNHDYNANASLYDIKEFFQGRNAQGKLNPPIKAKDGYYKQLYANLQDALKDLAKDLQPKVYEYGFLRE
ncbi:hypothetical protein [Helicobacter cetorum]|uniref:CagY like protein n=1 Tax=Helicobacter cetorum (strain ATCC BAA-540 / CCUG 52418 / MIT 99-5656) TaxID=1163745 RepID=I0EU78_HELCM|nr:hypothetical protein [Helicobacter cetorum]AFI06497.1 hypothetical protein HCD_07540 [Helicobacter cetorum MIT 99-5656]